MSVRVIINPRAGAGTADKKRPEIELALQKRGIDFDVYETSAPGHATALARQARQDGVDVIAVVGGDGTINEVAQAYVDEAGNPCSGPALALIPAGTGGDFRRTFQLSGDVSEAVQRIANDQRKPLDLGLLSLEQGKAATYAFLNIMSFGVSALTGKIANESPKWLGGKLTFLVGGARALAVYKNQPVEVFVDDALWYRGPVLGVAVANGQYYGGGMRIAPDADPSDGMFDVVAQCDLSLLQTVVATTKVYRGTHVNVGQTLVTRGKTISARPVRADQHVLVEMDGETPGELPITARVVPGALQIVA